MNISMRLLRRKYVQIPCKKILMSENKIKVMVRKIKLLYLKKLVNSYN